MGVILEGEGASRKLNELARHQMIKKLYADILADLTVCEIEGWDKREYIHDLQTVINRFKVTEEAKQ